MKPGEIHLNGDLEHGHCVFTPAPAEELVPGLEEIERRAYREAAMVARDHMRGVFAVIYGFKGRRMDGLDRRLFALECAIMAHGFNEVIGCRDFTQLAARHHCTKEMVRKMVNQIQKKTGLPPVPGQREMEGKKKMSRTRKEQLKRGGGPWMKAKETL